MSSSKKLYVGSAENSPEFKDMVQENEYLQELLNEYENELISNRNQCRYLQNVLNQFIEKTKGVMSALDTLSKEFKDCEINIHVLDRKLKELQNRRF